MKNQRFWNFCAHKNKPATEDVDAVDSRRCLCRDGEEGGGGGDDDRRFVGWCDGWGCPELA